MGFIRAVKNFFSCCNCSKKRSEANKIYPSDRKPASDKTKISSFSNSYESNDMESNMNNIRFDKPSDENSYNPCDTDCTNDTNGFTMTSIQPTYKKEVLDVAEQDLSTESSLKTEDIPNDSSVQEETNKQNELLPVKNDSDADLAFDEIEIISDTDETGFDEICFDFNIQENNLQSSATVDSQSIETKDSGKAKIFEEKVLFETKTEEIVAFSNESTILPSKLSVSDRISKFESNSIKIIQPHPKYTDKINICNEILINNRLSATDSFVNSVGLLLPQQRRKRPTLVIDLDDTLIFPSFIRLKSCDTVVSVLDGNKETLVYITIRPFLQEFIQSLKMKYELVLFTSAKESYARKVIGAITCLSEMDFYLFRDSCTFFNGVYVKDLSRLQRDLNKVLIVDNSPHSYMFQPENSIPIFSFQGARNDNELQKLEYFLSLISNKIDLIAAKKEFQI
ncbi:NLI interacting factor-like phosphatase [Hamiltosporidium magnivora]|uniref:NLI interacting factor-like phosphatase n=1 Tax=Hamiltosporidium magnivora TaxID=148818 RepID=A0A4Q9L124_9MICR|nr:NLI interacting factor-like phosphatase [Hamiltosporidium magnivora]